jgi:LETM1-like protein
MAKEQKKIATNRLQNAVGSEKEETVKQEQSAAAMLDFLGKARSGEILPADVIIQFASHFHDDLTLDNMPRMQLINMCRYMNIPPYGSDNFLRFQLRHKIRTLIEDDQRILWEGIGSLTKMELREACQERGMRSTGLSREAYRRALQQWLDLSVNKNVPISLLIMSRSFFLREEMTARGSDDDGSKALAGLADAISGLDQNIVNEVVLEVATSEEKKSDPEIRKIKLEVLEAQNERILEEQQQREAANKKKELQEKEKHEQGVAAAAQAIQAEASVNASETLNESMVPKADEKKNDDEDLLSTQEMDAISQLINSDPVTKEREELEKIKAAMLGAHSEEEKQALEKLKSSIVNATGDVVSWGDGEKMYSKQAMDRVTANIDVKSDPTESAVAVADSPRYEAETNPSTKVEDDAGVREINHVGEEAFSGDHGLDSTYASLKARVSRMVDKIESQLDSVEEKIGDKLHFLDKDGDGILDLEEMADALQRVLKRTLSQEEAMAIAALMVRKAPQSNFVVPSFETFTHCSI